MKPQIDIEVLDEIKKLHRDVIEMYKEIAWGKADEKRRHDIYEWLKACKNVIITLRLKEQT